MRAAFLVCSSLEKISTSFYKKLLIRNTGLRSPKIEFSIGKLQFKNHFLFIKGSLTLFYFISTCFLYHITCADLNTVETLERLQKTLFSNVFEGPGSEHEDCCGTFKETRKKL